MAGFNANAFNRQVRQALQKAEREMNQELRRVQQQAEREMRRQIANAQREVDAENRRIEARNRTAINNYNRAVEQDKRRADTHNQKVIGEINRRLSAASRPQVQVRYTQAEQELVDRVHAALPVDGREHDLFCSYARIDGADVAEQLYAELTALDLDVWLDKAEIKPGKSMARQMDNGLRLASAGVVVLTPAYLAGRFWTERELGALLHKDTVIPVLHKVTFADVREFSAILQDLAGFTTAEDSVAQIAAKIASAVLER
ncbi:toll/interleukin-1 receptor domain-containing protein [Micromonospora sp. NBC_01739]|uniref:toll/interleukin-1 receptor domain-containing protein n=1 Tax=Micromonospora sp. NBC_01739 TaxID=2975985 RepID=UPI002E144BA3|nr:toll/interleukin-1 receptor domain-containing protein [Micromonospora sp. NBC_01739]